MGRRGGGSEKQFGNSAALARPPRSEVAVRAEALCGLPARPAAASGETPGVKTRAQLGPESAPPGSPPSFRLSRVMAWAGCGPTCLPPWPPRYGYLDLAFALMGTVAFLLDLGADLWVAASYLKEGHYYWGVQVLALLVLSSVTTQVFSWVWYQNDPKVLRQKVLTGRILLILHILQLGYLYRCLHVLKVGFCICWMEAVEETKRGYVVFLSHDISMLRLFETFLESAPQLMLVLYVILHTSKAEIFQVLGICTSFLCIAWALLDYHQSLRSFLQDKHRLDFLSSLLYFLWNFLLVCPRIFSLALFTALFPSYIYVHFLGVWVAMFIWVSLQDTDFMEHAASEWFYRAVVAIILYFCWFNVAEGKSLHRSVIYHTFILLDSALLAGSWIWNNMPLGWDSHEVHALIVALLCYMLGILLRVVYYRGFHPTVQAASLGSFDEVDARELGDIRTAFSPQLVVGCVNPRTYSLFQHSFAGTVRDTQQHQENGTLQGCVSVSPC